MNVLRRKRENRKEMFAKISRAAENMIIEKDGIVLPTKEEFNDRGGSVEYWG